MNAARVVAGARLGWGVLLLVAPKTVLGVLAPKERNSPRARGVVLVLGARNAGQAAVELARPSRAVLSLAAGVDAIHALTFIGLAAAGPDARWRRAALVNVLTALAFCAATTTSVIATAEQWTPEQSTPEQSTPEQLTPKEPNS